MTSPPTPIRAPRGTDLTCRGWGQEAAFRMLQNNLDPEVAERPEDLVVYGGTGRAARSWPAYHAMLRTLTTLADDETMLVQSGRPVGVFRTHEWAPRVLLANSNLVPDWADWDEFRRLEHKGLMMYGQMTAGSWIYIGTQGILQGTYECFAEIARKKFDGTLAGAHHAHEVVDHGPEAVRVGDGRSGGMVEVGEVSYLVGDAPPGARSGLCPGGVVEALEDAAQVLLLVGQVGGDLVHVHACPLVSASVVIGPQGSAVL